MKILTAMVVGSILALSGCSFSAPGVHAHIGDADDHHGGSFCPPGNRMKGNC